MPSYHIMKVAERFKGYRATLDPKRQEIFDFILYELAGRREECLVNHTSHVEAMFMNVLIEQEKRLRVLEQRLEE